MSMVFFFSTSPYISSGESPQKMVFTTVGSQLEFMKRPPPRPAAVFPENVQFLMTGEALSQKTPPPSPPLELSIIRQLVRLTDGDALSQKNPPPSPSALFCATTQSRKLGDAPILQRIAIFIKRWKLYHTEIKSIARSPNNAGDVGGI